MFESLAAGAPRAHRRGNFLHFGRISFFQRVAWGGGTVSGEVLATVRRLMLPNLCSGSLFLLSLSLPKNKLGVCSKMISKAEPSPLCSKVGGKSESVWLEPQISHCLSLEE